VEREARPAIAKDIKNIKEPEAEHEEQAEGAKPK